MFKNKVLMIGTGAGVLIILIVVLRAIFGGDAVQQQNVAPPVDTSTVSADKEVTKVMALTAKIDNLEKTNEELVKLNEGLYVQNNSYDHKIKQLEGRFESALKKMKATTSKVGKGSQGSEEKDELADYEDQLASLVNGGTRKSKGGKNDSANYQKESNGDSIFSTYENALSGGSKRGGGQVNAGITWNYPTNRTDLVDAKGNYIGDKKKNKKSKDKDDDKIPYLTIPPNLNAFKGTAYTALVGRVPLDGKTTDPYRAQIVLGKDVLAAKGFNVSELSGMIVSGWAKGDFNLSCVTVDLDSYLFVFEDGTVVSKEPEAVSGGSSSKKRIGYIGQPNGFPCVDGAYVTNAPKYLGSLAFLNALSAAGEGYANAQQKTEDLPLGGDRTTTPSESVGDYVLGKTVSGAVEDSVDWIRQRAATSFDVIVTPPGATVDVFFEKTIEIDYDKKGRKLRHENSVSFYNDLD